MFTRLWMAGLGVILLLLSGLLTLARQQPAQTPLIYFTSNRTGLEQIYRMKPNGENVMQLTRGNYPSRLLGVRRDGMLLVMQRYRLYVGESLDALQELPIESPLVAFWGDENLVVSRSFGNYALYDLNESIFYPIHLPAGELPILSPDESQWVMSIFHEYFYHLAVKRVNGQRHIITTGLHQNMTPAWSPDGKWIAFSSDETFDYELYTIRPNGRDRTQLTDAGGYDGNPHWSPDGDWILFNSNRNGEADIYMIRPDGEDLTRLTDSPAQDLYPYWFPPREHPWNPLINSIGGFLLFNYALFAKHVYQFFHQIRRHAA